VVWELIQCWSKNRENQFCRNMPENIKNQAILVVKDEYTFDFLTISIS
jgi:hypothetical protein